MKLLLLITLLLFNFNLNSQVEILELAEERYNITTVKFSDKILFIGGSQGENTVDYLTLPDHVLTSENYSSDGFTGAKVLSNNRFGFFFDLSGVNTLSREYMIFDNENNIWSEGKYELINNADHGFIIGNNVYLIDDNETENAFKFDLISKTWETFELPFNQRKFKVIQDENKVYFIGGELNGSNIEILDIITMTWTTQTLSSDRREPNAILHDEYILVHGGFNDFSREVEIINTNTFESSIVNIGVRNNDAIMVANNSNLVLAGDDSSDAIIIDLNSLDFETYQLEDTNRLPNLTGLSLGSKIYLGGGLNTFSKVHIFDTELNEWENIDLNEGRSRVNMIANGNKLYISGGQTQDGETNELVIITDDNLDLIISEETLNVTIYPNPTRDFTNLEKLDDSNYLVTIFNRQGMKLSAFKNSSRINLSQLSQGLYIIEIKNLNTGQSAIKTIVKN